MMNVCNVVCSGIDIGNCSIGSTKRLMLGKYNEVEQNKIMSTGRSEF